MWTIFDFVLHKSYFYRPQKGCTQASTTKLNYLKAQKKNSGIIVTFIGMETLPGIIMDYF